MPLLSSIRRFFKRPRPRSFSLGRTGKPGIPGGGEDIVRGKHLERPPYSTPEAKEAQEKIWSRLGRRWGKPSLKENMPPPTRSPFGGMSHETRTVLGRPISASLDKNLEVVMDLFHAPRNAGLVVRGLEQKTDKGILRVATLYLEGLANEATVKQNLIAPLSRLNSLKEPVSLDSRTVFRYIAETRLLTARLYSHVAAALVEGECVVFFDGEKEAVTADTRSVEHRQVGESPTEAVVRGPHEGFVESMRTNVALVRRRLATPDLVSERHYVGARSHTPVNIVYLEGVVNPKLVDEVRRLVDSVKADLIPAAGGLHEYFRRPTWNLFPTHIATERPDRAAAMIAEGHIALLDDSPTVVLLPATIWGLMHSAEDYYIHPAAASALRMVRLLALFVTMYASALYVAVVTFHPEMIPTELMFAIASSREVLPFPAALEVTLMEIAFELVREAGVRIPSVIGPTIGIVGAVVLGQAAVQANIVSPILVVVVSIAGLGSFAIPNYDLGLFARILKFLLIGVATLFGIPGLTLASLILGAQLFSTRSLGVPVTAPLIPSWIKNEDLLMRGPLPDLKRRPGHVRPLKTRSSPEDSAGGEAPGEPAAGPVGGPLENKGAQYRGQA